MYVLIVFGQYFLETISLCKSLNKILSSFLKDGSIQRFSVLKISIICSMILSDFGKNQHFSSRFHLCPFISFSFLIYIVL